MIKICLTVRNRLAITKKCIEALKKHSTLDHQIYVYDNLTNYRIKEHHEYFYNLLKHGLVSQVTFNTQSSTFNAFSKAVSSNQFGCNHMMDPNWPKYEFLTFLDNDIIVLPNWDKKILSAWNYINTKKLNNVHIVGQCPGGITKRKALPDKVNGITLKIGKQSGSGFWNVRTSFFKDIGYLDLKKLVGHDKRHDSSYWQIMEKVNNGKEYIIGLEDLLCIHCGGLAGSICNTLTRNRDNNQRYELIKFKDAEEKIEKTSFQDFIKQITTNNSLRNSW